MGIKPGTEAEPTPTSSGGSSGSTKRWDPDDVVVNNGQSVSTSTKLESSQAAAAGISVSELDSPVWWDDIRGKGFQDQREEIGDSFASIVRSPDALSGLNVEFPYSDPFAREGDEARFSQSFDPNMPASGFSTMSEAINTYYQTSEDRRIFFQQLLAATGAFGLDAPPMGGWGSPFDKKYGTAWEDAVRTANRTGVPIMRMLRNLAENFDPNSSGGGGGGGPKRPTTQVISESDARELIDQVAQKEMGRTLSKDEEKIAKSIISAMQSRQGSEQNALIDKQMAGGGQGINPTSPQVIATEQIEEKFKAETGAHALANSFVDFIRLAAGG